MQGTNGASLARRRAAAVAPGRHQAVRRQPERGARRLRAGDCRCLTARPPSASCGARPKPRRGCWPPITTSSTTTRTCAGTWLRVPPTCMRRSSAGGRIAEIKAQARAGIKALMESLKARDAKPGEAGRKPAEGALGGNGGRRPAAAGDPHRHAVAQGGSAVADRHRLFRAGRFLVARRSRPRQQGAPLAALKALPAASTFLAPSCPTAAPRSRSGADPCPTNPPPSYPTRSSAARSSRAATSWARCCRRPSAGKHSSTRRSRQCGRTPPCSNVTGVPCTRL